ncbi:hypothetical protein D6C77_08151 [Aureobasidium pullulans]|nr:hypothetical protein D6C97_09417 [Aureobasidium pullulans]TIA53349.1 hypothetical protein D6C77_08151 [Aureobasidium pullulans]
MAALGWGMELEQNAERKNRDIGRRDSLILSAHAAPVKVFPLIGLTDSNPQAAETCIQALLYYPQKRVKYSQSDVLDGGETRKRFQTDGETNQWPVLLGPWRASPAFSPSTAHSARSYWPCIWSPYWLVRSRPRRIALFSTGAAESHLHEEAVAVGSRRSMEQRDIFDLDPLAEWRVLRGHGAMFLYDSSEMVKACIRGRLVDPDNRLHIADFLHPDLGPLRLLGYSLDDYVAMLRILVLKEFFR